MKNRNQIVLRGLLLLFSIKNMGQEVGLPSFGSFTPMHTNSYRIPNPTDGIGLHDMQKRERERIQQQNQQMIQADQQAAQRRKESLREIYQEINQIERSNVNYHLPSLANKQGTQYYRAVYDKMLPLDVENYSVKELNFTIENAFFENQLDKIQFDKTIQETGDLLRAKMKELRYDVTDNGAKNFMLSEFFTKTLRVKGFKEKHFPFKYDFEDYNGDKDWSKMFVTKLLQTGTGQCHSMPLLYLTLAEEIGAKAYLAMSPNHSYIKFQDKNEKWYNLELTNGMFTGDSFVLSSGFIRSEAIQNHLYMENLTQKELLSNFYCDLALGYIFKFGYDEFVEKVAHKALELYPNGASANMLVSNFNAFRFEYAMQKLGINPRNHQELQAIRYYPETVAWLNASNNLYNNINQLGIQIMPAEAYEKWLGTLKETKHKQENDAVNARFKGEIGKTSKN